MMKEKKGNNNPDPKILPPLTPNTPPEIIDPPVPNRAWTEMRLGRDIDDLSEMERRELYLGRDNLF